jgi:hypothetical protein
MVFSLKNTYLYFDQKKTEAPVFPDFFLGNSVKTPEKGLKPVRSCQTHPIVPKYIQKAQIHT